MLFKVHFHEAIRRREITCTVRIWQRPRVRVGNRYRLGAGAIEVLRIQEIGFEALTPTLARRSGFASLLELLKVAKHGAGEHVFLIDFRYVDAPTKPSQDSSEVLDSTQAAVLAGKLDAMDRRSGRRWTRPTLKAIGAHPGVRAADLAARLQNSRDEFKQDVRKLKALGLTISLEVGYRLSARGSAIVAMSTASTRKRRTTGRP